MKHLKAFLGYVVWISVIFIASIIYKELPDGLPYQFFNWFNKILYIIFFIGLFGAPWYYSVKRDASKISTVVIMAIVTLIVAFHLLMFMVLCEYR